MQHVIGICQLLLGVMCGFIATLMVIHNVNGEIVFSVMSAMLAVSGVALSFVGLYLVNK